MELFLVRHAKAIARSFDIPEEHRYLTPEGRSEFRDYAGKLAKKGMAPGMIFSSPLIRAVQTAEILAEFLHFSGQLVVAAELAPGADREGLQRLLARHTGLESAAFVGHEPDLSRIGTEMLGIPGAFSLKKGAVLALSGELDPATPAARFAWLQAKGTIATSLEGIPHS